MVDGAPIHIRNRMMKPLAITVSRAVRGWGRDGGSDLTNVQCKAIWNCHNESLVYNEYI
jgi:hypothetical protein